VRKKILIVDDHAAVRRGIKFLLETEPSVTVCGEAENGEDAVQKAKLLKPDLIILDLSMPVMNGFEAAQILKRTSPDTPLLVLTAHDSSTTQAAAHALGIEAVFAKGENLGPLMVQVRSALSIH